MQTPLESQRVDPQLLEEIVDIFCDLDNDHKGIVHRADLVTRGLVMKDPKEAKVCFIPLAILYIHSSKN